MVTKAATQMGWVELVIHTTYKLTYLILQIIFHGGDFTWQINIVGLPQMVLRKGSEKKFRSGPWNGLSFNGLPLITKTFFKSSLVDNVDEFYYSYELDDKSIITRLTLDELRIYAPAVEQNNQEVGYCVSTSG